MWDAKRSWDKWGWQKEFYETEGKNQWSWLDFSQGQSALVERPKGNRDSPVGFSSQEAINEERHPLHYTALR